MLKAAVKPCGFEHCEMALCHVDDVMVISHKPQGTIEGTQSVLKLKGDKAGPPDMHLGVTLEKKKNAQGTDCWTMSPEKCVKAAVEYVEKKIGTSPHSKGQCPAPVKTGCDPAEDDTPELNAEGLRHHQELIGILRWAVEIGRLDVPLEAALLSSHLAMQREGHLEQACHIFACLKHSGKQRVHLDPTHPSISEDRFATCDWTDFHRCAEEAMPSNMPTPRGGHMSPHCFVDSDHAGDKVTRRSQTGTLIFCNSAPTLACSKRQNSVECSTCGGELVAMRQAIELVKSLRCKLRMFGTPIEGATDVFCDNESVCKNASRPESVLNKKQHSVSHHSAREVAALLS
jgi:hypothetical protein